MDLMTKRLNALPTGANIQLCYGFMDGQNLMLTGTITDRDDSCLEITDPNGIPHYVALSTVRFFSPLAPSPTPAPVVRKDLLRDEPISCFSLKVSDYQLKEEFGRLGREEKRLLQKAYDSFLYGVSSNSRDKRLHAAETARRTILQKADRQWSPDAYLLTAHLLSREGIHAPELFVWAEAADRAAVCAFKAREWTCAATQAATALLSADLPSEVARDMLVILESACIERDDASLLPRLHGAHKDMDRVIDDLLAYKEARAESSTEARLEQLSQLYPNRLLAEALGESPRQTTSAPMTGIISKILWANETGEVTVSDGHKEETYRFRYKDVADEALLKKIRQDGSALVPKNWLVRFTLKKGEAVQLQRAQPLLTQAQEEYRHENYALASWYCRKAATGDDAPGEAMALMVEIALESKDLSLMEQAADLCEDCWDRYPTNGKALSLLAQLHYELHELDTAVWMAEQALEDSSAPAKLRATFLAQYCNYAMGLYNEAGDEAPLRKFPELTAEWLQIFHNGYEDDVNFQKRHDRILRWQIRGLLIRGEVEKAQQVYAVLAQTFPGDPKLSTISDLITQARQAQLTKKRTAPAPAPRPEPETPVADPDEVVAFDVPTVDPGHWEDLSVTEEAFLQQVFSMESVVAQTAALNAAATLAPGLTKIARTLSAAVADPMSAPRYDTRSLTDLISDQDERYETFSRYALACVYLRTAFQQPGVPTWMRDVLHLDLPALETALELLNDFARQTGQPIDRYAAWRDQADETRDAERNAILDRAHALYQTHMAAAARDNGGGKFARFVDTKAVAHGQLKTYLQWVLREDRDGLLAGWEDYRKHFLTSGGRISDEKVDQFIVACWEATEKDYPTGEGEDLQGTRRNALRCSVRAILTVVEDYRHWLAQEDTTPRTEKGGSCFAAVLPRLEEALTALTGLASADAASAEERTGLRLLAHTAGELLAKLRGTWQSGQERWFYEELLQTGLVELDDRLLPDMTGLMTGPLGMIGRIFAHDQTGKLTTEAHIARIFGREYRAYRNFDTAALLRHVEKLRDREPVMPDPQRYIDQAKLVAELELRELLEAFREPADQDLKDLLLWLYDRCVRKLRFGYLYEGMELIRGLLKERSADAA